MFTENLFPGSLPLRCWEEDASPPPGGGEVILYRPLETRQEDSLDV